MRRIRKAASHAKGVSGTFSKKGKLPQTPPVVDPPPSTSQTTAENESLLAEPPLTPSTILTAENESLSAGSPLNEAPIQGDLEKTKCADQAVARVQGAGMTENVPQDSNRPASHKTMSGKVLFLVLGLFLGVVIERSLFSHSTEMPIDRPVDRLAIQSLMKRYAHAYDTKDWDSLRSVFVDGATLNYEAVGGIKGSVDEAVEFMTKHNGAKDKLGLFTFSQHFLTTSEVLFDGEEHAFLEDKFFNPVGFKGFPIQPTLFVRGSYTHELVKVNGEWKSMHIEESVAYKNLVASIFAQLFIVIYFSYKALLMVCSAIAGTKEIVVHGKKGKSQ